MDFEEPIGDVEYECEPIVISQEPPQPKFENPVKFAHPCPLGSHIIDTDQESAIFKPWWSKEKRIEEEPIVSCEPPKPKSLY